MVNCEHCEQHEHLSEMCRCITVALIAPQNLGLLQNEHGFLDKVYIPVCTTKFGEFFVKNSPRTENL